MSIWVKLRITIIKIRIGTNIFIREVCYNK